MNHRDFPEKQGLYDPHYEHDACGMGFVVDVSGRKSHSIIKQGMQVLLNFEHRGNVATDEDKMTSVSKVFAAGDMARGQSLVVWAIADGRHAVRGADQFLRGGRT